MSLFWRSLKASGKESGVIPFLVLALLTATGANAASVAERMAARSGEVIGAAAGCGVSEDRLIAVGQTTVRLLIAASSSPSDAERARKLHERAYALTASNMAARQPECPAAIAAFEQAERN